jgi:hypothetical protein
MNNECFERLMMTDERKEDKVRKRLSLGWTPSPAYPSRLGVAGSVLIPASSNAECEVESELKGWVGNELSSIRNAEQR